jgi:hypothetical protein
MIAVLVTAATLAAPQQVLAQQAEITRAREAFVQAYEAGKPRQPDGAAPSRLDLRRDLAALLAVRPGGPRLWSRYLGGTQRRLVRFRDVETRYADNVSVETGYMEMYMDRPPSPELIPTFIRYSITRVRRTATG